LCPTTKNLPTAGRGIAEYIPDERWVFVVPFSSSCIVVVACRIRRKEDRRFSEEKEKRKKKRKRKRNCPKKFVTGLKRKEGSPEKRYFN
jgi:hypothetical protein